jgi:hypothetical protein
MGTVVTVRYLLASGIAAAAAACDLLSKALATTPDWGYHGRSPAFAAVSLGVLVVLAALCALPSRSVAVGCGFVAGGVAGNLVSAAQHANSVPDPFVAGPLAFSLGDVCVVLGAVVLVTALARVAIAHRSFIDRHVPPRAWERRLRQRLGL